MTQEMHLLCENAQEITLRVWAKVWNNNKYDKDSRDVLMMLRDWAEEFEAWWQTHDEDWMDAHDYLEEIWEFADRKAEEYIKEMEE